MRKLLVSTAFAAILATGGPVWAELLTVETPTTTEAPAPLAEAPKAAEKPADVPPASIPEKAEAAKTAPTEPPKDKGTAATSEKPISEVFAKAGIDPRCTERDPLWSDTLQGCFSLPK